MRAIPQIIYHEWATEDDHLLLARECARLDHVFWHQVREAHDRGLVTLYESRRITLQRTVLDLDANGNEYLRTIPHQVDTTLVVRESEWMDYIWSRQNPCQNCPPSDQSPA